MSLSGFSFRIGESRWYDVTISEPSLCGTARILRRLRNYHENRRITVAWPIVQTAEKDAIVADFDAAKGMAGQVTLTHPVDGALTCRFSEDKITVRRRAAGRFAVQATVEVEPVG